MEKKAKQTVFMAKMKVYEAFKNGTIPEDQANYFIDMIEKSQIKLNLESNFVTNEYFDVIGNIYNDCKIKAKEQGFGYKKIKLFFIQIK